MIQKKYFPQQDTPNRVKDDIMNKLHQTPKKVRLMYMSKYKIIIPTMMFLLVLSIGYLDIKSPHSTLISQIPSTNTPTETKQIPTKTIATQETNSNTLQQEIIAAETTLNELSNHLNEEDITL
ncbi:MAG: hypothetical protein WCO66_04125 [Candidatus Absconditabacteria bacterium]|jgi:hypothetical protein